MFEFLLQTYVDVVGVVGPPSPPLVNHVLNVVVVAGAAVVRTVKVEPLEGASTTIVPPTVSKPPD